MTYLLALFLTLAPVPSRPHLVQEGFEWETLTEICFVVRVRPNGECEVVGDRTGRAWYMTREQVLDWVEDMRRLRSWPAAISALGGVPAAECYAYQWGDDRYDPPPRNWPIIHQPRTR